MWKEMVPGVMVAVALSIAAVALSMVAVLSQWLLLLKLTRVQEGRKDVCKEVRGEREMRMKTCS